jgi:very-short-patch-repair endonuclease
LDELERSGLSLKRQVRLGSFVIDAICHEWNVAIEFDGEYWHSLPGAAEKDQRKAVAVAWAGLKLIRVPEREWLGDPQGTIDRVIQEVNQL